MERKTSIILAIGGVLAFIVAIIVTAALIHGYHEIKEGHVGIYYRFGALRDRTTDPGMHFMKPFIDTFKLILIRPEEKDLGYMEAVTKDGIEITFKGVSVLSKTKKNEVVHLIKEFGMDFKTVLIYDRVREDLRIFCANKTIDQVYNEEFLEIVEAVKKDVNSQIKNLGKDGVVIMNLVIPKPDIPQDIEKNYKQVKVQWTQQLVAEQQQKTEEIKKETERINAVADAQRQKDVLEIKIQEQIIEMEGKKNISEINNEMAKERENNLADIAKYAKDKEAAGNKELYSPEYVKLQMAQSLANNTKFYFSGQESVMGGLLTKILAARR